MTKASESLHGRLQNLVAELASRGLTLDQACREFERQFILEALSLSRGNMSRCAEKLGVHRNTLRNKVDTLGLTDRGASRARRPAAR